MALTKSGTTCGGNFCIKNGFQEYGGLCGQCFANLNEDEREALLEAMGDRSPRPPDEIHNHRHEHIHPPQSRLVTTIIAFVSGAAGAAAFELAKILIN